MKKVNNGAVRATMLRHQMQLKAGMQDNPYHGQHIQDFCAYTDAMVEAAVEGIMEQLPQLIRQELEKKDVSIKVEEKSYDAAKVKIKNLADILRNMWH